MESLVSAPPWAARRHVVAQPIRRGPSTAPHRTDDPAPPAPPARPRSARLSRVVAAVALAAALTWPAAPPATAQVAEHTAHATPIPGEIATADEFGDVPTFGDTLSRRELIGAVLARNLELRAAEAAWEAARQRVPQATSLPDPEVSVGLAPLSIASNDVDFGASLEARQRLPYPGKLRLRGEAAEARAEARGEMLAELRLGLARLADDLFYDLYLVDRAQEINDEHIRLLEELKETATNRYASGLAPQQAPLQAEVELTHLVHRAVTLRTERSVAVARLNALLHRPPLAPLPRPEPTAASGAAAELEARLGHGVAATGPAHGDAHHAAPETPLPGTGSPITRDLAGYGARADDELVEELARRAVAARPEVAALEAEVAARRVERELATLERKPDFGVMGTYSSMWRQTEHQFMLGVTVSLPIWGDRLAAAEAEADAALAETDARRRAELDAVRSEVAQAAERLAEMAHVVDLYESRLLPAARDQLRAARAGFETGKVTFTSLIDAERNLRSVDLGYEGALTDRYRRRADLQRALGVEPGGGEAPQSELAPDSGTLPDPPSHTDSLPETDLAAPAAGGTS